MVPKIRPFPMNSNVFAHSAFFHEIGAEFVYQYAMPRAVPIVEAMAWLCLCDHYLRQRCQRAL